jgi:hypothetical protein
MKPKCQRVLFDAGFLTRPTAPRYGRALGGFRSGLCFELLPPGFPLSRATPRGGGSMIYALMVPTMRPAGNGWRDVASSS